MRIAARAGLTATALIAALGLTACGSSGSGDSGGDGADGKRGAIEIVLTDNGCAPDVATAASGAMTFNITNKDATGVTEVELLSGTRILAEKENLAPGFSGSFSLKLTAGDYEIYCPGAKTSRSKFTVTGEAAPEATGDDALTQGAALYADYVKTQAATLVEAVGPLVAAIQANDVPAAKQAYANARSGYERIEPVAESFALGEQNLDADIDAREGDVPDNEWRGFHVIEKGLWVGNSTTGLLTVAQELQANVTKLQGLVADLEYQPAELANGAVALLEEVISGKITGEEERYSHIDLLDFAGNVEGAQQAFAFLQPGLESIDSTLSEECVTQFAAVTTLLEKYTDAAVVGGYVLYTTLTPADTVALANAVQALVDPLSGVAAKVV
ncbi:MAG: Iron uptake system component EfeO [Pseudonocardiales bacterium]|nr:Iron uptake system component EfeO [Pseudonocardiales bacterium]